MRRNKGRPRSKIYFIARSENTTFLPSHRTISTQNSLLQGHTCSLQDDRTHRTQEIVQDPFRIVGELEGAPDSSKRREDIVDPLRYFDTCPVLPYNDRKTDLVGKQGGVKMPKKRKPPVRASRPVRPRLSREWTASQVRDLLTNPTHGYGIVLEPADQVPAAMQHFGEQLADEQNKRGFGFTLQELDERFQSFFVSLVESGSFTRGTDVSPSVPKETWLQAQQVAIGRLARGEPT